MAKNETYKVGAYLPAPVPADTKAGVPRREGIANFITQSPEGEAFNLQNQASTANIGVWAVPLEVVTAAASFGTPVYFITATGILSTASAGGKLWGATAEPSPIPVGQRNALVNIIPFTV